MTYQNGTPYAWPAHRPLAANPWYTSCIPVPHYAGQSPAHDPSAYYQTGIFASPERPTTMMQPLQTMQPPQTMQPLQASANRILHLVLFSLKPGTSPEEARSFLQESINMHLSVPVAENFKLLCQTNPDNEFPYAFYVEFASPEALQAFLNHPNHLRYVQEQWNRYVGRSLISNLKAC